MPHEDQDDSPAALLPRLRICVDRLLSTAAMLSDEDVKAPSLLPGWTRAHVLTHLARSANSRTRLLTSARTGTDLPQPVGGCSRVRPQGCCGLRIRSRAGDLGPPAVAECLPWYAIGRVAGAFCVDGQDRRYDVEVEVASHERLPLGRWVHQQRKALRARELEERRKTLQDTPEAGMVWER